MFALKSIVLRKRVDPMDAEPDSGFVLPRPLRRSMRFLLSLCAGRVRIPSYLGSVSTVAFFASTGFYGMSLGGHTQTVAQVTTTVVGFAIENVKVAGNFETSEIDILQQLGLDGTTSLVSLSVTEVRDALSKLPWVQSVDVRKVYPDTIQINLKERQAFAIWQHGDELSLIEKSGNIIAPLRDNKFSDLPLFVGLDADKNAAAFFESIQPWESVRNRAKAYIKVAGRRWDMRMDNGITVKLPADDVPRAMDMLARMQRENQLLDRDIVSVDLRLSDRTAIELTPEAQSRRQAMLDQRTKDLKKAGKQI
ncbi:MAG: hypothetical protein RIR97_681 [Pseudomonadota bacterium]